MYWEVGKSIAEKQSENWDKAIVPTLSKESQNEFPGVGGFSVNNLWLMAQFYSEYHSVENSPTTGWRNKSRKNPITVLGVVVGELIEVFPVCFYPFR